MDELKIYFTKKRDGSVVSLYERADGTSTWQRNNGTNATFFVIHDLTHYAVETILNHHLGFYGLISNGWDLKDFGTPWPRGPLPIEAEPSELIVGFLDMERAMMSNWSVEDLNSKIAEYYSNHSLNAPPILNEAQLENIREQSRELRIKWDKLPDGETMELIFKLQSA